MVKDKCKEFHKYGPFLKSFKNEIYRTCLCCLEKRTYPVSEEIVLELAQQDEASQLLNILLYQDNNAIKSSDDYIKLIGCLADNLSYLYINESTQNKFIEKISLLNNYFHKNRPDRYEIINEFVHYLRLYFRKENMEIRLGLNSFPEEEAMKLDLLWTAINDKINQELEDLYDLENRKNHQLK